jgi:endonuclease/exonuclease/phosphatase family metal-dependent hydrolase
VRFQRRFLIVVLLICSISAAGLGQPATLRIVTLNIWSGLDYLGTFSVGEFESEEQRMLRSGKLVEELRRINPDVLFLQEVNPVVGTSRHLADKLGMEQVHQVCNSGIKFLSIGLPTNLMEGMTILAKPQLQLTPVNAFKLSGSIGIHGDVATFHLDESIFALVGQVLIDGRPVYLVNVHLSAIPPGDSVLAKRFDDYATAERMAPGVLEETRRKWTEGIERRERELAGLTDLLGSLPDEVPRIVAGDFNMEEGDPQLAPFLAGTGLSAACAPPCQGRDVTWDPTANENIVFSTRLTDAGGTPLDPPGVLDGLYDQVPRTIDHILLSRHFPLTDVLSSGVVFRESGNNPHISDHHGVMAEVDLSSAISQAPREWSSVRPLTASTLEPFPIVSYDTDAGFGLGVKAFALNFLRLSESFDLLLFGTSRGERWGRGVFSIPDFELRQGKVYPLAVDLTVDYDKWIHNSFFGIGNGSLFEDREYYTRTPLDVSVTFGRGFTGSLVAQAGIRYLTVENSGFEPGSSLEQLAPEQNRGRATATSLFASVRSDSRDSYISPSSGLVTLLDLEFALRAGGGNVAFTRVGGWFQGYFRPFVTRLVVAGRFGLQGLVGDDLPVQILLPIGGNKTVRGAVQDRYLDKVSAVANIEARFPIVWRFGGVLGFDAGKVWHSLDELDIQRWSSNPVAGLRFSMETYVVRLDVGLGKETTGFYLNFGQVF